MAQACGPRHQRRPGWSSRVWLGEPVATQRAQSTGKGSEAAQYWGEAGGCVCVRVCVFVRVCTRVWVFGGKVCTGHGRGGPKR